jgi:hypothetical protein
MIVLGRSEVGGHSTSMHTERVNTTKLYMWGWCWVWDEQTNNLSSEKHIQLAPIRGEASLDKVSILYQYFRAKLDFSRSHGKCSHTMNFSDSKNKDDDSKKKEIATIWSSNTKIIKTVKLTDNNYSHRINLA